MKSKRITPSLLAAAVFALCASAPRASAQSVDALLDKLVEKGVISVREANQLREETEKNFTSAHAVKTGMPEWVSTFKFSGDVRARYEGFFSNGDFATSSSTNQFTHRHRFRYRLRFGATVTMLENLEAGFRLTSSEPSGNFGGDPISGNTTMQDNGSKKFIYVDQAYGRWYMLNTPRFSGVITVGKMENPMVFDDMVFDGDYTPEGLGVNLGYRGSDKHSFRMNAGAFLLDEVSLSGDDPFLLGAQVRWDAVWNPEISTTIGASILSIQNTYMLTNGAVPNVNRGNTRTAAGAPAFHFNPVVLDAAITYNLERFPMYRGPFPIRVGGAYMNNPAAPSSADNYGWNAGVTFGKSGKKGMWDFSYAYKWLGANAWYEELVDSDFGALYFTSSPPNSGASGGGYASGANVRGHILRFQYSPSDSVTLAAKWFMTDLINDFGMGGKSDMHRLQVDANWKF